MASSPRLAASCPVPLSQVLGWLAARGHRTQIEELPGEACVNWVAAAGDVVVRVCKLPGDPDARTESVAVPVVVGAGIRTPRLLDFDETQRTVEATITLYERWPGVALGTVSPHEAELPGFYRELGRELGHLHSRVLECPDPFGWLDEAEPSDPEGHLEMAVQNHRLDAPNALWLGRWIERLRPANSHQGEPRFLHNDAHSFNTMALPDGSFSGILDWGDAGWGDPAFDFSTLPLWAVPWALEGYREVGCATDPGFCGRVLGYILETALDWENRNEVPGQEPWSPTASSLHVNLARFLATDPGPEWREWLPQD